MAGRHRITQKTPMFGNHRPFSLKKTRRIFQLNIQSKRMYLPDLQRFVRVMLTANELRTVDKIGLSAFLTRQGRSLKGLIAHD